MEKQFILQVLTGDTIVVAYLIQLQDITRDSNEQ